MSKSERTKQFIIEKAAPIFNRKGFSATSMNDILAVTGLAKGGVYGNFINKEELAIEVFEYANAKLLAALSAQIKTKRTAYDKLFAILSFYHNYSVEPLIQGGCPLLNHAVDSEHNFPEMKQRVAKALEVMLDSLIHIIKKGIESKEFKNTVNAQVEAALIFAVIEGGIMMSQLQDNAKHLNELLTYLEQHISTYKI